MEGVNGKVIKKAGDKGKAPAKDLKEGRPVAVDWALSKEKWEENQKTEGGKEVKTGGGDADSDSEDESGEDSGDEDGDSEDEDEEAPDEVEDDDNPHDEDVEMAQEEPIKPQLPTVDVGSTLFIRNLPFEVTEQELGAL